MKGFPDLPPIWWLGTMLGIYGFKYLAPALHFETSFLDISGRVLVYAAIALVFWSAYWFWQKKTPIEPFHTPKALVVEGPYRVSRNPIYLALVMITFGSALGNGSLLGIALAVGLLWVLDRRFVSSEEAGLREQFGADAETYLTRTRRWI